MNEVIIKQDMCKGCQFCIQACPKGLIQLSGKLNLNGFNYATFKGTGCTGCGFCYYACPELDALEVYPDMAVHESGLHTVGSPTPSQKAS